MEVILNKDVDKIGKAGEVVKVKDGFGRNFLIPNGLAVLSNPSNLRKIEQEKQKNLQHLEKIKHDAEALRDKLSGLSLTIQALAHEDEKLYGSVSEQDIASALKEEGFDIDKNIISLAEPIKALGIFEVPLNLHPEITAKIKIWVVKK